MLDQIFDRTWRDPLARNATFLMVAAVFTAGVGFVFWTVTANLFTPHQVGTATALLSATGLVGAISGLGFGRTLVRFLPGTHVWGPRIATMGLLSAGVSFVVAIATYAALVALGVASTELTYAALFVLACVVATSRLVVASAFVAARRAHLVLAENVVGGVVRLASPFMLVAVGALGIFLSHVLSLMASAVFGAWFLRRLKHRFWTGFSLTTMKGLWSFSLGSWLTDLVGGLPGLLLPIIIASRLGTQATAYWYMAFMVATFLYTICSSVSQSLLAEASHDEKALRPLVTRATVITLVLVTPSAALLMGAAPFVLRVFGEEYVGASEALRILVASTPLIAASYIFGTVLNIYKRIGFIAVVNILNALVILVPAVLVVDDLSELAWYWMAGELVNTVLFVAGVGILSRRSSRTTVSAPSSEGEVAVGVAP